MKPRSPYLIGSRSCLVAHCNVNQCNVLHGIDQINGSFLVFFIAGVSSRDIFLACQFGTVATGA
jgi:hypothetical protein